MPVYLVALVQEKVSFYLALGRYGTTVPQISRIDFINTQPGLGAKPIAQQNEKEENNNRCRQKERFF